MEVALPIIVGLMPVSLIVLAMFMTMRGRLKAGVICAILAVVTFAVLEIVIAYGG